ncbi:MAG: putative aminohydrolase SsnA [Candidatus Cloacimonetes bacterium]|nr:putative aminohydrolase SsnA [Candidatus Cloacimonadota bacterium]
MKSYLITGGTILTFDPESPVLEGHALWIEDGKIRKIAPDEEFAELKLERISAEGKVVLPGFINAHHHFYSTLVRGLGKAKASQNFNEVLENLWWRLDKKLVLEDVYISALISGLDATRHGCTTVIDHHASPFAITGSLSEIARATKACGIRSCLCYEVSDRDGKDKCREGISENMALLDSLKLKPDSFLSALFGLHAAFTLEDETLRDVSDYVHKTGCGIHVHAAEAESDQKYNIKHHGLRVMERFADFDLINSHSIFAHGVHLNAKELLLIASAGAAVVTNPQSNLNNAVGIADLIKMRELGILIGLGTDAMTTNMLEELRVALWTQHLKQNNPSCGFMEVLSTLTINNPRIASRYFEGIGILKPGYQADIILMDYQAPTPLNADTWMGHLLYGLSQATVDTTICAGEELMWNKQIMLDLDEEELLGSSRRLATDLWDRF